MIDWFEITTTDDLNNLKDDDIIASSYHKPDSLNEGETWAERKTLVVAGGTPLVIAMQALTGRKMWVQRIAPTPDPETVARQLRIAFESDFTSMAESAIDNWTNNGDVTPLAEFAYFLLRFTNGTVPNPPYPQSN